MFLKCKSGADAIATAALNGKFAIYELDFQVLSDRGGSACLNRFFGG